MSNIQDEDRLQLMELGALCSTPMALNAAVKLNVPEIISSAGESAQLSASEIVQRFHSPSKSPAAAASVLERILRALSSRGVFKEVSVPDVDGGKVNRKFGLTNISKHLVKDEQGDSLAPWITFNQDEIFMKSWKFLYDGVVHGEPPFTKAHGLPLFELAAKSKRLSDMFNVTMASNSSIYVRDALKEYGGFKDIGTLVDVGGGWGATLGAIVAANPNIKGINFDLEHVISEAPALAGVEHVGGDMFESVPAGDAIFMKWILHDWGDEDCIKLLRNCHRALPSHGKVIVMDVVLPSQAGAGEDDVGIRMGFVMDMLMLAYTSSGKERTENDFNYIGKAAGFARVEVALKIDYYSIIEMYKT